MVNRWTNESELNVPRASEACNDTTREVRWPHVPLDAHAVIVDAVPDRPERQRSDEAVIPMRLGEAVIESVRRLAGQNDTSKV